MMHEVPRGLPEISFKDNAGRSLTLADLRGSVVVLNVWATWCSPCREEMPTLDHLQAKFDPRDVAVVALSVDRSGLGLARKFFDEIGVRHLSPYNDGSARALRELGLVGLPGTLVIDRTGREIGRLLGSAEWDGHETVEFLKTQVKRRPQNVTLEQGEAQ
ncbi:TlpA family protein disulfide reductase [Microvirga sp. BT689]|uniref:TlpA family protein disulfide reductase n=1 Tax=Microvirga arvi TaxID=2778731 RepID=UPI00194F71EC|nr:TlpA disulfide reductase family protein [Microvirga arvi]MBM6582455.1 TlpA family protein disulfide reductase [Microvirga arvi]